MWKISSENSTTLHHSDTFCVFDRLDSLRSVLPESKFLWKFDFSTKQHEFQLNHIWVMPKKKNRRIPVNHIWVMPKNNATKFLKSIFEKPDIIRSLNIHQMRFA